MSCSRVLRIWKSWSIKRNTIKRRSTDDIWAVTGTSRYRADSTAWISDNFGYRKELPRFAPPERAFRWRSNSTGNYAMGFEWFIVLSRNCGPLCRATRTLHMTRCRVQNVHRHGKCRLGCLLSNNDFINVFISNFKPYSSLWVILFVSCISYCISLSITWCIRAYILKVDSMIIIYIRVSEQIGS